MNKLISVVIPTYNRGLSISKCIESVLIQNYDNIEILICDDFSTDNTREVFYSLYGDRSNIIFLQREDGLKGANAARNNGIIHASGEYILFLDSDDILTPNSIAIRIAELDKNSDIDMIYGDASYDGGVTKFFPIQRCKSPRKYMLAEMALCPFSVMLARKSVFQDIPLLENELLSWQDDDFVLSLILNNKTVSHCGAIVCEMYVGVGETNISSDYRKKLQGCRFLVNKYQNEIKKESYFRYVLWKIRIIRDEVMVLSQRADNHCVSKFYLAVYRLMTLLLHPFFYKIWG